jgi:endoglucanase
MKLLTEMCSLPTAPFVEGAVIQYVERFAQSRPKLKLTRDSSNNLLLELRGRSRTSRIQRIVFVAHMDHPGFVARRMIDDRTVEADFRGGVFSEFVSGARVVFFSAGREIQGVVESVATKKGLRAPYRATVRVGSRVSPGSAGMFNLGEGRVRNSKFHSRVCDDLAGAAAALAMLDELARKPPRASVAVLLTRAEEVGFVGAIASVLRPKLLSKSDIVISIECSAEQPYARQGDGVILRVGDRMSIFDSDFMYFFNQQAEQLAKRDRSFRFQRALMPGGACEASVFAAYGYTTGAACVPLGNYHNMNRATKTLAAEYVDVNDWKNMVKLFVHLARNVHTYERGFGALRKRIESRFEKYAQLLRLGRSHAGSKPRPPSG